MSSVTILLSTFNGAAFIDEQVQSIMNQHMSDWKLIVRDDGSTDQTIATVQDYALADRRITLLPLDGVNKGPAKSFLEMLPLVDTPYFAFADQDDVWMPQKLTNSLEALRETEIADAPCAVFGDAVLIRADGSVRSASALATRRGARPAQVSFGELLLQNVAMGGTMLGNRALAEQAANVDANLAPMHDWACGLIAKAGGALSYRPTKDLLHRQHDMNRTGLSESLAERLGNSLKDGFEGWSQQLFARTIEMGRACQGIEAIASQREVQLLTGVAGHRPTPQQIRGLAACGVRLRPAWRQAAVLGTSVSNERRLPIRT